jgi:T5SS/PEP-CTERM-associated repeat protein
MAKGSIGRAGVLVALLGLVLTTTTTTTTTARGQTVSWTNVAGGLFSTPGNWSAGGSPDVAAESALFDLNSTYTVTFTGPVTNGAATVNNGGGHFSNSGSLEIGDSPSGNGTLVVPGAGSRVIAGLLNIADQGTALASISAGGNITTTSTMNIGTFAGSEGVDDAERPAEHWQLRQRDR